MKSLYGHHSHGPHARTRRLPSPTLVWRLLPRCPSLARALLLFLSSLSLGLRS